MSKLAANFDQATDGLGILQNWMRPVAVLATTPGAPHVASEIP